MLAYVQHVGMTAVGAINRELDQTRQDPSLTMIDFQALVERSGVAPPNRARTIGYALYAGYCSDPARC
jgi:hypothetical protein